MFRKTLSNTAFQKRVFNQPAIAVRTFSTNNYPASMQDEWLISKSLPVPAHIIRPPYVGKKNQKFPALTGKIHIHS